MCANLKNKNKKNVCGFLKFFARALFFVFVIFPFKSHASSFYIEGINCNDCPILYHSGVKVDENVSRSILSQYYDFSVPAGFDFLIDKTVTKDGTGSLLLTDSVAGKMYPFKSISGLKLKPGFYEAKFLIRGENINSSLVMGMKLYTEKYKNSSVEFAGSEQLVVPGVGLFDWSWYTIKFPGYICDPEDAIKMVSFFLLPNSNGQKVWIDYMDISEILFPEELKKSMSRDWCDHDY